MGVEDDIEKLLTVASHASTAGEWDLLTRVSLRAVSLDPDNADAAAYLAAARANAPTRSGGTLIERVQGGIARGRKHWLLASPFVQPGVAFAVAAATIALQAAREEWVSLALQGAGHRGHHGHRGRPACAQGRADAGSGPRACSRCSAGWPLSCCSSPSPSP